MKQQTKQPEIRLRPHIYPLIFRGCFFAFGIIFFLTVAVVVESDSRLFYTLLTSVLVIIALLDFWRFLSQKIIVNENKISYEYGILWKEERMILTNKCESIEVERGLFDVIFGTANLTFTGTGLQKLRFKHVKKFREVQMFVHKIQEKKRAA